jgi:hypothetical protein
MTALSPAFAAQSLRADRATRMTDTFEAWRALENYALESQSIAIDAATLPEAAAIAAQHCQPRDGFSVVQTDGVTGKRVEHVYRAKRSTRHFTERQAYDGGRPVRIGKMEAEHLFSRAMLAFEPAPKWECTRGADVVGGDRGLVEVRS